MKLNKQKTRFSLKKIEGNQKENYIRHKGGEKRNSRKAVVVERHTNQYITRRAKNRGGSKSRNSWLERRYAAHQILNLRIGEAEN